MTSADHIDFDRRIETLIETMVDSAFENRLRIVDLLVDLRFALGSPADGRATANDR